MRKVHHITAIYLLSLGVADEVPAIRIGKAKGMKVNNVASCSYIFLLYGQSIYLSSSMFPLLSVAVEVLTIRRGRRKGIKVNNVANYSDIFLLYKRRT